MPMKKYAIFISSTYSDLIRERKLVRKALLHMNCFPVCMEQFPATDQNQFEYIKRVVSECDYYILILGGRIGSICQDTGKSYTEMEYEYALEIGIPVIAFIKTKRDGQPINSEKSKKSMNRYSKFVADVQKNRIRRGFNKCYELYGGVLEALREEFQAHPQPGWRREYRKRIDNAEGLLLKGDLLYKFVIGSEIYDYEDEFEHIPEIEDLHLDMWLKYGIDTQEAFKLILFAGQAGINLYNDVPSEYLDANTGKLSSQYKMQVSLARLGNNDELLLFFSIGDMTIDMKTFVYRMSNVEIKKIAQITGQQFMFIDYTLDAFYGSQGCSNSYTYCNGNVYLLTDINHDFV